MKKNKESVNNPVAKYAHQFNRNVWMKDKKKALKLNRFPKHKKAQGESSGSFEQTRII